MTNSSVQESNKSILTYTESETSQSAIKRGSRRKKRRQRRVPLMLILLWITLTLALIWPTLAHLLDNTPQARAPWPGGVNYLIVAPEYLERSALEWASFRRSRGYTVHMILVPAEYTTFEYIRDSVQRIYLESGRPYPFFVLLLGHSHSGSSFPDSYLPTGRWDVEPVCLSSHEYGLVCLYDQIASDDMYAMDTERSTTPYPMAIGRVPARTNAEALRLLERTRSYELSPPVGIGRTQIEVVTSESGFGERFDWLVEHVAFFFIESQLPTDYRWHLVRGSVNSSYSYPVADFPSEVARRMDQEALIVSYFGHSSQSELSWVLGADGAIGRVFGVDDLPLIQDAQRSVVTIVSCYSGEYDADGNAFSLAERLLLTPSGPVATYAASRITSAMANLPLGKDLFQGLLTDQPPTIGEWLRQAETNYQNPGANRRLGLWFLVATTPLVAELSIESEEEELEEGEPATLEALRRAFLENQFTYNLFGDPALALAYPRPQLDITPRLVWQPLGQIVRFSGRGDVRPGQSVMLALEAPPSHNLPHDGRVEDAILSYEWANERLVSYTNVTVVDPWEFTGEIQLPPGLPGGWYILKATTVRGDTTLVGSRSIYLGGPPIGKVVTSTPFLWGLVTVLFVRSLVIRRRKRKHPNAYLITWRSDSQPHSVVRERSM